MNLEIDQAAPTTGRTFKALSVALTIFAVLVIGTVAVLAISERGDSTVAPQSASTSSSTYLGPTEPTAAELATVYFLVESEAQRTDVFFKIEQGEWVLPIDQGGDHNFIVLLAGTPEEDAKALSFLDDEESRLRGVNADMRVIDLRSSAVQ